MKLFAENASKKWKIFWTEKILR